MKMQEYFDKLSDTLMSARRGSEILLCNFEGESTDFARINKNRFRQCGNVQQAFMEIRMICDGKHLSRRFTVSRDLEMDISRIESIMASLREDLTQMPLDPYFSFSNEVNSTTIVRKNDLPPTSDIVRTIIRTADGTDLVGIYAGGDIFYGFTNSLGQRNWFEHRSFNFNFSLYQTADKAVQNRYSGTQWNTESFERQFESSRHQLRLLSLPPRTIAPGHYTVYLAPAALYDVIGLMGWDGFGLKAHRTRTTPLIKLADEAVRLHPSITITEQTNTGSSPNFQNEGFIKPDVVALIKNGRYRNCLISPRSAREFNTETNGANTDEFPVSLVMAPGELAASDIENKIGDGIFVNTLFYLNYSDRAHCKMTGMTRFATFWVENGKIVAPLDVMRFDESVYRILGDNLIGLTREREHIADPSTYDRRATDTCLLPGALVKDFALTL